MNNLEQKIEAIFRKYAEENNGTSLAEDGIPPTITFDIIRTGLVFKELTTLINSIRKESVEGFVEYVSKEGDADDARFIKMLAEEYLNGSAKQNETPETESYSVPFNPETMSITNTKPQDNIELKKEFEKEFMFPDGKIDCYAEEVWDFFEPYLKDSKEADGSK